jgi:hypothetical protein
VFFGGHPFSFGIIPFHHYALWGGAMSNDYTKTWNRLFGVDPASESEATRLLRDLERANALPDPKPANTVTLTLSVEDARALEDLLVYVPSLTGETKDTLIAWKIRDKIAALLDEVPS